MGRANQEVGEGSGERLGRRCREIREEEVEKYGKEVLKIFEK